MSQPYKNKTNFNKYNKTNQDNKYETPKKNKYLPVSIHRTFGPCDLVGTRCWQFPILANHVYIAKLCGNFGRVLLKTSLLKVDVAIKTKYLLITTKSLRQLRIYFLKKENRIYKVLVNSGIVYRSISVHGEGTLH